MKTNTQIEIVDGDITTLTVDAIVNPANSELLGGGGVDGQIHYVAGPELVEECRLLGGCETGQAKITKGYHLPAKYVIHTVGPIYGQENGQEEKLLRQCYINCLDLAEKNNLKTIAFPAISTGIFRFPKDEAAAIVKAVITDYLISHPSTFEKITFALRDPRDIEFYNVLFGTVLDTSRPSW